MPGQSEKIWAKLVFDEELKDPSKPFILRVPEQHHLVLRLDNQRIILHPGDRVQLGQGELHYLELRKWMGYKVFYDWTRPWLLATILICICSLGGYYRQKFFSNPWQIAGPVKDSEEKSSAESVT